MSEVLTLAPLFSSLLSTSSRVCYVCLVDMTSKLNKSLIRFDVETRFTYLEGERFGLKGVIAFQTTGKVDKELLHLAG